MSIFEKYFKDKTKEEKQRFQQWIFFKAQSYVLQSKPFNERTNLPLNKEKWKT